MCSNPCLCATTAHVLPKFIVHIVTVCAVNSENPKKPVREAREANGVHAFVHGGELGNQQAMGMHGHYGII